MKNIQGTEENLELFNENGIKVYKYYKHSNGFSYEYTRDSNGNELTFKNSKGVSRGFDKTYTLEEVEFIKRAVQEYWEHCFAEHPENQNDLNLTQQILSK